MARKEKNIRDDSVYTGSAGYAYLNLLLSDFNPENEFFKVCSSLALGLLLVVLV